MAMAHPRAADPTPGGHDHEFVDTIEPFKCPMCLFVAKDPVQTENCGHTFCQICWHQYITLSPNPGRCPLDNEEVGRVFVDRNKKRMIDDLMVNCDYRGHGCDRVMELRDVQAHMTTCQYQLVTCDLLCGEKVLLWSLPTHKLEQCVRRCVICPLCADKMLAQDMQYHKSVCREEEVMCEWCNGELLRKLLSVHLSLCLECPTYCSFALHGCTEKMERRKLTEHHKTDVYCHMEMLNVAVMGIHVAVGRGSGDATTEATPHLQYELPVELYHAVETAESDATVPWSELPGMVCEAKAAREPPLCDRVCQLETVNMQLINRIAEASEKCANGNAEVTEEYGKRIAKVKDDVAALSAKHEKAVKNHGDAMVALSAMHEKVKTDLEGENKRLSDHINLLVGQMKRMTDERNTFVPPKLPIAMRDRHIY